MWIATKDDLKDVIKCEKVLRKLEPTMDRNYAHELIANLYVKYVVLCNNLSELYDQTLQAQKRQLIESLLISSQERLKEIQKDIQKIEMSQFVYVDDALVELNFVPYDIEFLRPFYFPRRRGIEEQIIIDEIPKVENKAVEPPKGLDKLRPVLTPEEIKAQRIKDALTNAANAVKYYERMRQVRVFGVNMKHMPEVFKPPTSDDDEVFEDYPYNFYHRPGQAGFYKLERKRRVVDLYAHPINVREYDFYEPPTFRINKLGRKVLVKKKKASEDYQGEQEFEVILQMVEYRIEQLYLAEEQRIHEEEMLQAAEHLKLQNNAARLIQRNYFIYLHKMAIKRLKKKQLEFCQVLETPVDKDKPTAAEIQEVHMQKRREKKKDFDEALIKALEDEKARILKVKSETIMEDITEDIRAWFYEFYKTAKDFHRYPEEFEGGTIMVMRGETKTPEEFLIEKNKSPAEKAKDKELKKKERKEKKQQEKKAKENEKKKEIQRKKMELKQGPTWNFAEMKEWKAFENFEKIYTVGDYDWKIIDDTYNDPKELPEMEFVTADAYADVHQELRLIVDNFMRVELELLRIALAVDTKTKYVPPKPKKEKKKKKKKSKEKEVVDVFEDKSAEEHYQDLRKLNIIVKYTKKSLRDFIGDYNYAAMNLRQANKDPQPQYGDIKSYIQTEILGTSAKSFCIIGPPRCGKKYLVDAICTEMDAVMFDLSAPKIKQINDMPEFCNLIIQMAVKFQPSVLFIDGAHKPFIRKISSDIAGEDPRKLGKYLLKNIVKNLTDEDAVKLIGVTNEPWNCNFLQMKQCYEKFAVFPAKLDYGTAVMAWKTGFKLKRILNVDVSSLAQATRNFSVGDILDSIDTWHALKDRVELKYKPLTSHEFLENLITTKQPVDDKVVELFNKFARSLDPHLDERTTTMARVQVDIDKKNEEKRKKKEMQKKKEAKKALEKKNA
ncbi:dynein regulatory complex protein 11-like [Chironomus tepperi]|uniref:dynein regulatory complex protein 11-like n=1 Tax=Chironomus tepperi TaxID=113505 RepID=UPI00391EF326